MQFCQKVDKSVDSYISSLYKLAKEDYLEKISLFENPLPSYDPHSLVYGILKGLYITQEKKNINMEVKMSQDVKKQLNEIKKNSQQALSQWDSVFIRLEKFLATMRDNRTYDSYSTLDIFSRNKENNMTSSHSDKMAYNNPTIKKNGTNSVGSPGHSQKKELTITSHSSREDRNNKSDDS